MWDVLKQNLTYSIRALLKTPGFTVTGMLTLALGIGATTAIFSVVYAVFEPMPYPNPDQLVMVTRHGVVPGTRKQKFSRPRRLCRLEATKFIISRPECLVGCLIQCGNN